MKEGLKYTEFDAKGEIISNRVITRLTDLSVFSKNIDASFPNEARESIKSFVRRSNKGYYKQK